MNNKMSNLCLCPVLKSQLRQLGITHANELRDKEKDKLVKKIYDNVLVCAINNIIKNKYEYSIEDTRIETFEDYEKCIQIYQTNIVFNPSEYIQYQFGIIRGTLSKDFIQDVVSDLQKLFPDSLISHVYKFTKYIKESMEEWKTICILNYDEDKSKFDQVIKDNINDDVTLSIARYIIIDWSETKI
jgi:hypothetical protein